MSQKFTPDKITQTEFAGQDGEDVAGDIVTAPAGLPGFKQGGAVVPRWDGDTDKAHTDTSNRRENDARDEAKHARNEEALGGGTIYRGGGS